MFDKFVTFVKANQAAIVQKTVIGVGAVAGLAIALVIAKAVNNQNSEQAEPEAPAAEESTDENPVE